MINLETILTVQNLKRVFKKADGTEHCAVNDISFDLKEGEIFSFLGPNGAGKSTTINMLTTQLSPTEGSILLDGQDVFENPIAAKRKIGIVAQHNNLDRGLTAYENLVYHGKYFGMSNSEARERALKLLKDFGLYDWRNDYVKSFSGGMAQRLKIARAIMHKPKLLFLDEPTTGLDPAYRETLWDHVLKLNAQNNTTVFLTTHYMEEPERFSDRVAIYSKGEIRSIGTIDELREMVPSNSVVELVVDKSSKDLIPRLQQLPAVKRVQQNDEKRLTIYPNDEKNVLNQIIPALERTNSNLVNISLSKTTLDDIYIYLTEHKGAEAK